MRLFIKVTVSFLVIFMFVGEFSFALSPELLGKSGDWQGFVFNDSGEKACYASSGAVKSEGKYKKRGAVVVYVSHFIEKNPANNVLDQVSIEMGYPVKSKSKVTLTVRDSKYSFGTSSYSDNKETVYLDSGDEKGLIKNFKLGYDFELEGRSQRGTKTYDKFSLKGFSKVYSLINKACK